jgi:competence protein CoiA
MENETEWHRNWKKHFPDAWQEVVQRDSSGEFHRADVKTEKDWVLEFQYSAISPVERSSRIAFKRACDVTSDKSALLRDWSNNKSPVLFDFNEPNTLWCLLPRKMEGKPIVVEIVRQ